MTEFASPDTDLLPPPPAEINLAKVQYDNQGGRNHQFLYQPDERDESYQTGTVAKFMNLRSAVNVHHSRVASFAATIKQYLRDEEIDADVARDLADYFDVSLTREIQYCVQVEFTFTAELPLGDDEDDVIDHLNFEVSTGYGSSVDISDFDVNVIHSDSQEV